ncbi:MAG: tRNA epoxyqueuosine(34) reductase QueG [Pseudomonadota bacterium]
MRAAARHTDRAGDAHAAAAALADRIRTRAAELGADAVGIASLAAVGPELKRAGDRLSLFLAEGRHGDMDWLADTATRRAHPNALWPDARTAIVIGQSYAPERDPLDGLAARDRALISAYAQGRDYHDVLKGRLKVLGGEIAAWTHAPLKVFVDTAPLMEKPLAALAGIGWQGKHTNLVSRAEGSWLFLGVILTASELPPDAPHGDHCGACRRCLDVCPTDAFPAPYQLDARRCLAYWSIEAPGPIPHAFRAAMGNRVFGCDDCLAVCPWNKFAVQTREARYRARDTLTLPRLSELLGLDDAAFRKRFAGTPVKRTGRNRFLRNVAIAAGNSADPTLIDDVRRAATDASPLVRGAAVWALRQLLTAAEFDAARDVALPSERDADVRAEWTGDGGATSDADAAPRTGVDHA